MLRSDVTQTRLSVDSTTSEAQFSRLLSILAHQETGPLIADWEGVNPLQILKEGGMRKFEVFLSNDINNYRFVHRLFFSCPYNVSDQSSVSEILDINEELLNAVKLHNNKENTTPVAISKVIGHGSEPKKLNEDNYVYPSFSEIGDDFFIEKFQELDRSIISFFDQATKKTGATGDTYLAERIKDVYSVLISALPINGPEILVLGANESKRETYLKTKVIDPITMLLNLTSLTFRKKSNYRCFNRQDGVSNIPPTESLKRILTERLNINDTANSNAPSTRNDEEEICYMRVQNSYIEPLKIDPSTPDIVVDYCRWKEISLPHSGSRAGTSSNLVFQVKKVQPAVLIMEVKTNVLNAFFEKDRYSTTTENRGATTEPAYQQKNFDDIGRNATTMMGSIMRQIANYLISRKRLECILTDLVVHVFLKLQWNQKDWKITISTDPKHSLFTDLSAENHFKSVVSKSNMHQTTASSVGSSSTSVKRSAGEAFAADIDDEQGLSSTAMSSDHLVDITSFQTSRNIAPGTPDFYESLKSFEVIGFERKILDFSSGRLCQLQNIRFEDDDYVDDRGIDSSDDSGSGMKSSASRIERSCQILNQNRVKFPVSLVIASMIHWNVFNAGHVEDDTAEEALENLSVRIRKEKKSDSTSKTPGTSTPPETSASSTESGELSKDKSQSIEVEQSISATDSECQSEHEELENERRTPRFSSGEIAMFYNLLILKIATLPHSFGNCPLINVRNGLTFKYLKRTRDTSVLLVETNSFIHSFGIHIMAAANTGQSESLKDLVSLVGHVPSGHLVVKVFSPDGMIDVLKEENDPFVSTFETVSSAIGSFHEEIETLKKVGDFNRDVARKLCSDRNVFDLRRAFNECRLCPATFDNENPEYDEDLNREILEKIIHHGRLLAYGEKIQYYDDHSLLPKFSGLFMIYGFVGTERDAFNIMTEGSWTDIEYPGDCNSDISESFDDPSAYYIDYYSTLYPVGFCPTEDVSKRAYKRPATISEEQFSDGLGEIQKLNGGLRLAHGDICDRNLIYYYSKCFLIDFGNSFPIDDFKFDAQIDLYQPRNKSFMIGVHPAVLDKTCFNRTYKGHPG